jgi:GrpB-like predicted nucleotidyltransferase (UPF0157 family)
MLDRMQKRPYSLEDPSDYWTNKFKEVKKILDSVFDEKALSIDHVGSTSLGIKAKPLLDILVIVKDIKDIFEEKEKMKEFGYFWEDEYIAPDTSFIYKLDGERKIENIHIVPPGHFKVDYFLLKRDYFLAHPQKLKEYEDLKAELNKKFPDDYPAYRAGKEDFLENIYTLAKEWRDNK